MSSNKQLIEQSTKSEPLNEASKQQSIHKTNNLKQADKSTSRVCLLIEENLTRASSNKRSIRLVNPYKNPVRFVAILKPTSLNKHISIIPQSGIIESYSFVRITTIFHQNADEQLLFNGQLELHYKNALEKNCVIVHFKPFESGHTTTNLYTNPKAKKRTYISICIRVARLIIVCILICYNLFLLGVLSVIPFKLYKIQSV